LAVVARNIHRIGDILHKQELEPLALTRIHPPLLMGIDRRHSWTDVDRPCAQSPQSKAYAK
jgi:hypothetical protein